MSSEDRDPNTYFSFDMRREGKNVSVNIDKPIVSINHLLYEFANFLRGCGYSIGPDEILDIVSLKTGASSDVKELGTQLTDNVTSIEESEEY